MRVIEHRRHTMRVKPGLHLSQAGVDLARSVGEGLGPFDRVITSSVHRAFETAIAMGFAVDEQLKELGSLPEGFEDEVKWDEGFLRFAEVCKSNACGYCEGVRLFFSGTVCERAELLRVVDRA